MTAGHRSVSDSCESAGAVSPGVFDFVGAAGDGCEAADARPLVAVGVVFVGTVGGS